ncbi:ROK family protein [Clostridium nigeriense]|uniref:ROK family protein n=1 Tax=Clostridium nigeriense TaxID=1805470 RepID=UPI003D348520
MKNYIVFDIGGSSVKWSVINNKGVILISGKIAIAETIEGFFEELSNKVNNLKEEYTLQGIALSAPGAVDNETGIIGGMSALPYIHGPNFKEILNKMTGLQAEIENDANCAALGECWLGAAKEENDCAFVVCGTGIGGALVKDKKIHSGVHKHGGEFGYCLVDIDVYNQKYLSWSMAGSTFAVSKFIADRKGISMDNFNGIKAFELYDNGDEIAIEEVNRFFRYMAIGIYNIQYTYDPEVIVLGGAICERKGFLDEVNKKIDEVKNSNPYATIKPIVRICKYGNDANKLGALYNFLQKQNLI